MQPRPGVRSSWTVTPPKPITAEPQVLTIKAAAKALGIVDSGVHRRQDSRGGGTGRREAPDGGADQGRTTWTGPAEPQVVTTGAVGWGCPIILTRSSRR